MLVGEKTSPEAARPSRDIPGSPQISLQASTAYNLSVVVAMVFHTGCPWKCATRAPTLSVVLQMAPYTAWLRKECDFCTHFVRVAPHGPPYRLTCKSCNFCTRFVIGAQYGPLFRLALIAGLLMKKSAISAPTLWVVLQMVLHRCQLEKIPIYAPTLSVVLEMVHHTGRFGASTISAHTCNCLCQCCSKCPPYRLWKTGIYAWSGFGQLLTPN